MLELLAAWVLFPVLAGAVCLGLGLLADRMAGGTVPGALLLPLGFAGLICAAQTITYVDSLAELATPAVVLLALAGAWLGRARLKPLRPDRWAAAAGAGVFAVYAAPIVLSGAATFAGYTLLGDNSIHFILADWVGEHGPHVGDLAPSSYQVALDTYLTTAYPLGAHAALAAVAPFGLQDVPWVYQPFLALIAALAALGVYGLLGNAIGPRPLRALAAFVAAQPALVYGYALQGSIKELCVVTLLVLLAALVAWLWREGATLRRTLVLAIPVAAGLGVLNLAIAPYFGPLLLAAAVVILGRRSLPMRDRLTAAAAGIALVLALSVPTLASSSDFVEVANVSLTGAEEFGNLIDPLRTVQVAGIWPRGDYRLNLAEHTSVAYVLIGFVVLATLFGALLLVRRFSLGPALLLASSLIGSAYAIRRGSPWADGKALMIASPAVVVAAFLGIESLRRSGRRAEAALVVVAIAGGVLWTNALAFRWADEAPRDRLEQLADIDDRIAGQGPTLYPEFDEFAKFFLRDSDPTGSTESWQPEPRATVIDGGSPGFGTAVDPDRLAQDYIRRFRTIVLRRSPASSRPPAAYERAFSTADYVVWQRPAEPEVEVVRHEGLGEALRASAVPDCERLRTLARSARQSGGRLAFVERPPLPVFEPALAPRPPGWDVDGFDSSSLRPRGAARVEGTVSVSSAGRYDVWVQGSFAREVAVEIDGRRAGAVEPRLSPRGGFERAGEIALEPGEHRIAVVRPTGGVLDPGSDGGNRLIGPVALRPAGNEELSVSQVDPREWRSLCGRTFDWIEVVRES